MTGMWYVDGLNGATGCIPIYLTSVHVEEDTSVRITIRGERASGA